MFAQTEILRFTPGRRQEALDRLAWMHRLMKDTPGFHNALIAKYLGDATRYLVLRYWQDEESYKTFHTAFTQEHAPQHPRLPGLFEIEESQSWECYYERSMPAERQGSFLLKTHRRVPAEAWDAYTPFQQDVEALTLQLGGLTQVRRLRSRESTDILNVQRYPSRDDFERYFESAPHLGMTQRWPEGIELISTQCYEVVAET